MAYRKVPLRHREQIAAPPYGPVRRTAGNPAPETSRPCTPGLRAWPASICRPSSPWSRSWKRLRWSWKRRRAYSSVVPLVMMNGQSEPGPASVRGRPGAGPGPPGCRPARRGVRCDRLAHPHRRLVQRPPHPLGLRVDPVLVVAVRPQLLGAGIAFCWIGMRVQVLARRAQRQVAAAATARAGRDRSTAAPRTTSGRTARRRRARRSTPGNGMPAAGARRPGRGSGRRSRGRGARPSRCAQSGLYRCLFCVVPVMRWYLMPVWVRMPLAYWNGSR